MKDNIHKYTKLRNDLLKTFEDEGLMVADVISFSISLLITTIMARCDSIQDCRIILTELIRNHLETLDGPDTEEYFQHKRTRHER